MNLNFRVEEHFEPYWIDVYLPEFHIGIEADGPFHTKKKDEKRDEILMNMYDLPVLRIKSNLLSSNKNIENVKMIIESFIEKTHERRSNTT